MKWPKSNQLTCIHGLGSSVVDYAICDILVSNQITTFDLLNDHEPESDHKPLTLNLKFSMHRSVIEENFDNQRYFLFDKSKVDIFLKDLNSKLNILTYKDNFEELYLNFTTTLSTSINKFPFEVSYKRFNRMTNLRYDKECKIARKFISDASNESLKLVKINTYKSLTKRKKMYYINKRKEKLSQLYKLDPKKFCIQIINCNTKENNKIPLRDWNSYLKSIYEFPNAMDTIPIFPAKEEVFSLYSIEFGVKWLANEKAKDIEGYQDEMFKIRGPILIPHIHKLFTFAVKEGFPKLWMQNLIVPIFKNGDRNIPSNYRTIMISPILAKLYVIVLEKKIIFWL
jgi:hypothetical protein